MIDQEAKEQAIQLLADIALRGAELANLLGNEARKGNFDHPVTMSAVAQSLITFTQGVTMLRAGAETGFAVPETIGLIPESDLPDFNLDVPVGTPDN